MRALLLLVVVLGMCGCVSNVGGGALEAPASSIRSILVYENLGSAVSRSSRASFRGGLETALQACHVSAVVHDRDPLALDNGGDDGANLLSLVRKFGSDAVLAVRPVRSWLHYLGNMTHYDLRMLEVRSGKLVWQGQATLTSGLSVYESGEAVAAGLVANMAKAGILRSCVPSRA